MNLLHKLRCIREGWVCERNEIRTLVSDFRESDNGQKRCKMHCSREGHEFRKLVLVISLLRHNALAEGN